MGMLARLGVVLGLNSAEFQKGLLGADKQLQQLAATAKNVAMVGGVAFTALTYKALDFADQITDTARANDIATASVLALSKSLVDNGGQSEKAGLMLASFSKQVESAVSGTFEAQQNFNKLGVSLQDLNTLDTGDLFEKTLTSVGGIQDAMVRNATAMELFGKASKGVAINDLARDFSSGKIAMEQYAQSVDKAGRMHDQLKAKTNEMMLLFTAATIPTLSKLYDSWSINSSAVKVFFNGIETMVKYGAVGLDLLLVLSKEVANSLNFSMSTIKNLASGNFSQIAKDYKAMNDEGEKLWAQQKRFSEGIFGESKTDVLSGGSGNKTNRNLVVAEDKKAETLAKQLEAAGRLSEEYARQNRFALEQLTTYASIAGLAQREQDVIKAGLRLRQDLSNQLYQTEIKILDARAMGNSALAEALQKQKNIIEEQGKAYITLTESMMRGIQAQQYTFSFGWEKSFNQFKDDAMNYSKAGEDAFAMFTDSIGSAIDQFATNGTTSFKKFTLSIIKDISLMITKFYAMQLAMIAVGFISKFFGGTGTGIGNMGSASLNPFGGGGIGTTIPSGPMAEGGNINSPRLVGELGPEIFIPKGSGTIIPNNKLSDSFSSGQPSIVYNGPYIASMSAIDTQSAMQFLAKNKMGVWAANQSANRSVPVNR